MSPRKKQHESDSAKARAHEERLKAAGKRRVCLWIDRDTADALKALATERRQTQGEIMEELIRAETEKT